MDPPNEIVAALDYAAERGYHTKNDISKLSDNLKKLKGYASGKERKSIDNIRSLIKTNKVTKAIGQDIQKERKVIDKVIKKYEEEYEETPNDDNIDEEYTIEEVEQILDNKIANYKKYKESKPMFGVKFLEDKNRYRARINNIDKTVKNLELASNIIMENFNPEKNRKNVFFVSKIFFSYNNHFFITYWYNGAPYFDIQHIISTLNLKPTSWNNKYVLFSKNIKCQMWHKNQYDGYILRELINEETMYSLLFSSHSEISEQFKKDISKILVQLRKDNKLTITNNSIKLNKSKNIDNDSEHSKFIIKTTINAPIYTYNNKNQHKFIQELLSSGANFKISKFTNKHVLYMYIISLKRDHSDIIVKIGYTEDLDVRWKSLKSEFKCNIYFVKAKIISGQKAEKKFHNILKTKYEHLIEPYKPSTNSALRQEKIELYKFSPVLLEEFDDYPETDNKYYPPHNLQPQYIQNKQNYVDAAMFLIDIIGDNSPERLNKLIKQLEQKRDEKLISHKSNYKNNLPKSGTIAKIKNSRNVSNNDSDIP